MTHSSPYSVRRVLVVDDDDDFRAEVCRVLRDASYDVCEADGALAAMRCVLAGPLDVVVLDLGLPDGRGIEVARAFRAVTTTRDICVVAMAAESDALQLVDPGSFGAASILVKPMAASDLLAAVEHCFEGDQTWTGEYETPAQPVSTGS